MPAKTNYHKLGGLKKKQQFISLLFLEAKSPKSSCRQDRVLSQGSRGELISCHFQLLVTPGPCPRGSLPLWSHRLLLHSLSSPLCVRLRRILVTTFRRSRIVAPSPDPQLHRCCKSPWSFWETFTGVSTRIWIFLGEPLLSLVQEPARRTQTGVLLTSHAVRRNRATGKLSGPATKSFPTGMRHTGPYENGVPGLTVITAHTNNNPFIYSS